MHSITRALGLATALVCLAAGTPAAQGHPVAPRPPGQITFVIGEVPVAGAAFEEPPAEGLDAGLFGQELLAFALKEAFPDAEDEYEGISGIRGPLDERSIDVRHRFGDHCLWVVSRLWVAVRETLPGRTRRHTLFDDPVRRHGSTLLAGSVLAHGVWRALRNEIVDRRDGMALRPRISSRKVALELKLRW